MHTVGIILVEESSKVRTRVTIAAWPSFGRAATPRVRKTVPRLRARPCPTNEGRVAKCASIFAQRPLFAWAMSTEDVHALADLALAPAF